jgi:hypothetical protein
MKKLLNLILAITIAIILSSCSNPPKVPIGQGGTINEIQLGQSAYIPDNFPHFEAGESIFTYNGIVDNSYVLAITGSGVVYSPIGTPFDVNLYNGTNEIVSVLLTSNPDGTVNADWTRVK